MGSIYLSTWFESTRAQPGMFALLLKKIFPRIPLLGLDPVSLWISFPSVNRA